MNLIQENPYRIIGILSNAQAKEIQNRKAKILAYAKVGKQTSSEYDFSFLNPVNRDQSKIEHAFSSIQQSKDMLENSMFWFSNTNSFDKTAIGYLINGEKDKAKEIWEKVTLNKKVSINNYSCFNNIGTLKLLELDKLSKQQGYDAKIKLIESEYFENFVKDVAGEAYLIDSQKQVEQLIDVLLVELNKNNSTYDLMDIFINSPEAANNYLIKKLTEAPTSRIESSIERTKKKRNQDNIQSYILGNQLYNDTKSDLSHLKSFLGTENLEYKRIADSLAKEIMQCGIDYFNSSQEQNSKEEYLENALSLNKLALKIAAGKLTIDKAKDHISTLEEMKDQDVNNAIAILNSIKEAYQNAINDIDAQVSNMRMSLRYNQTINYSKVDKLKAECLNWDKVVEVIIDEISVSNVIAIQNCPNQNKVSQYKNLVDFLLDKLGPFQINKVKHLCYWKDVRASQAKSTAKQVGNTIGKATDGCYIATMAYGDYDHPQVLELRKFRDEYLRKTQLGSYFISIYYRYSPTLVEKLKDKPKINELIRRLLDQLINTIRK